MNARTRLVIALSSCVASCDRPDDGCRSRSDCADDEACWVSPEDGTGSCVPSAGHGDPPPVRVFAGPPATAILFVVDDGPGSAAAQARLIDAMPALLDATAFVGRRLRVAATSATVARPGCDSRAYARSGRFAHTSCLDRLDDFVAADGTDDAWVCTSRCSLVTDELPIDPERPWIDLDAFADPTAAAEVLACLLPQGTSGCDRSSPLHAVDLALHRVNRPGEPESGAFAEGLDRWPSSEVVVVTDGMDCSVSDAGLAAFDPAGDRTLWPDPTADAPNQAVCWSAGVECSGEPPAYDDCVPIDRDPKGVETTTGSVLLPLDSLAWLELGIVDLHVIAGVPVSGSTAYRTDGDPAFVAEHGVAPACEDDEVVAAPALRLQELTDVHSICAPTYDAALREAVGHPAPNLCVRSCAVAGTRVFASEAEALELPACQGRDPQLLIPASASACATWRLGSESCKGEAELVLRTRDATQHQEVLVRVGACADD